MRHHRTPISERFWPKVDVRGNEECWLWTGSQSNTKRSSYGKISEGGHAGRILQAHRVAYELTYGPIPEGLHIDHLCRVMLCVNPRHLEAVTPGTNNSRSDSPPSHNERKTHCPQGHEYTVENTGYKRGTTWRYCRSCAREYERAKRTHGLTYSQWRMGSSL